MEGFPCFVVELQDYVGSEDKLDELQVTRGSHAPPASRNLPEQTTGLAAIQLLPDGARRWDAEVRVQLLKLQSNFVL